MVNHPRRIAVAAARRATKFEFSGQIAKIVCEELNFRFEARFVGVHVTDGGHIVICGSAGHIHEFNALEVAVRNRGWHWNRADVRRPHKPATAGEQAVAALDQHEHFELDRELIETMTGRSATDADVLAHRAGEAVKKQAEAERRHEVDLQIRTLASNMA